MFVPPSTDRGTLPNLRFSFSDAHMRRETGGWNRQVTERELGISKDIAGVNMRLNAGGVDRAHHGHRRARAKLRRSSNGSLVGEIGSPTASSHRAVTLRLPGQRRMKVTT
jgi:hypothetical protein